MYFDELLHELKETQQFIAFYAKEKHVSKKHTDAIGKSIHQIDCLMLQHHREHYANLKKEISERRKEWFK